MRDVSEFIHFESCTVNGHSIEDGKITGTEIPGFVRVEGQRVDWDCLFFYQGMYGNKPLPDDWPTKVHERHPYNPFRIFWGPTFEVPDYWRKESAPYDRIWPVESVTDVVYSHAPRLGVRDVP